jgi:hypothetical protein
MLDRDTLNMAKDDAYKLMRILLNHDRSGLYDLLMKIKFDLLSVEAAEEQKKISKVH